METKTLLVAASLAAAISLRAVAASVATSNTATFDLDDADEPIVVKSVDAVSLPYAKAVTVKQTTPAGATSTLVSSASSAGSYSWNPSAGGEWKFANSRDGEAVFLVRYTLFGAEGDGTAASPLKLVDGEELAELVGAGTFGDGCVFELMGDYNTFAQLERPEGYAILVRSDGNYELDESASGKVYSSLPASFGVETKKTGYDRTLGRLQEALPIAYTGDGRLRSASASSTVTVTSPSGASSSLPFVGTGAMDFTPDEKGVYTVTLAYGSKSMVANIAFTGGGFFLVVR